MITTKQLFSCLVMSSNRRALQGGVVVAFLALMIASTVVLGHAPPDTTISRVPNPQLFSDLINLPGDLRAIPVPTPPSLNDFVKDPAMARALGKALFWDMQVGSDGVQACASCHFERALIPDLKTS